MVQKLTPKSAAILKSWVRKTVQDTVTETLSKPVTRYGESLLKGSNTVDSNIKAGAAIGIVRCLALAGGNPTEALGIAKHAYGNDSTVAKGIFKAISAGDATAGGFLIPEDLSAEIIEKLRPLSVVRRLEPNYTKLPRGSKNVPVLTGSATASYVGENQDIPVSEPTFGEKVFVARKLTCLVPLSNESIRYSFGNSETTVRDDMIKVIATQEDVNLLRGDGTANKPNGIRNQIAAGNVLTTNGTTATQIESDFIDLKNALDIADVRTVRPKWVMHPSRFNHLLSLRDSNGNLIYPELRTAAPSIHTFPVLTTTSIPTNLSGTSSELYLIEGSEVDLGEVAGIEIAVTNEGAYVDADSVLRSAFTRDQTLIRAIMHHDVMLKHDVGAAVMQVAWGT